MYWLTVDENNRVKFWVENKPQYFEDTGAWARPTAWAASSTNIELGGWPLLTHFAESFDLKPGPEGIVEVTIEMKAAQQEE